MGDFFYKKAQNWGFSSRDSAQACIYIQQLWFFLNNHWQNNLLFKKILNTYKNTYKPLHECYVKYMLQWWFCLFQVNEPIVTFMAIDLCHLSGLHIILTFVLAILVCTVSRTVKWKPCSSSNRVFWYFVKGFYKTCRLTGISRSSSLSLSLDVQLALIWASKLISSAACGGRRNSLVQMMSRGRIKKSDYK